MEVIGFPAWQRVPMIVGNRFGRGLAFVTDPDPHEPVPILDSVAANQGGGGHTCKPQREDAMAGRCDPQAMIGAFDLVALQPSERKWHAAMWAAILKCRDTSV